MKTKPKYAMGLLKIRRVLLLIAYYLLGLNTTEAFLFVPTVLFLFVPRFVYPVLHEIAKRFISFAVGKFCKVSRVSSATLQVIQMRAGDHLFSRGVSCRKILCEEWLAVRRVCSRMLRRLTVLQATYVGAQGSRSFISVATGLVVRQRASVSEVHFGEASLFLSIQKHQTPRGVIVDTPRRIGSLHTRIGASSRTFLNAGAPMD